MTMKTLVVTGLSPGTPVRVTADESLRVHKVLIESTPASVGLVYLGLASLVRATLVNVMHVFRIVGAGQHPMPYEISAECGGNRIQLSDLWIDVNTGNDGVIVTYFTI